MEAAADFHRGVLADDAEAGDDPEYNALITSAYVREGGEWKLTFHQQTPS